MSEPLQIWEPTDEPNWQKIGWAYDRLKNAAHKLQLDIDRYKAALNELDGAGTDIGFGKERIAQLHEDIRLLKEQL